MNLHLTLQHFLLGLFAVANCFPAIGLFLQITRRLSSKEKIRLCRVATLTSFIVMSVALVTGTLFLDFFGISIEAFRIAGGFLLCTTGLSMLKGNDGLEEIEENLQNHIYSKVLSVAIVPVAIPLTTGAGTISTIIIYMNEIRTSSLPNNLEILYLIIAIIIMSIINYLVLKYSMSLMQALGTIGMNVVTKIMGLITLAIGVQFIINGIVSLVNS